MGDEWTRVVFGDVVRQVKVRVDPEKSGLERYVAGEHMDTDDLRIRRWGRIGDGYLGPAFHMRFNPGEVLYGSRRTYLRKVAVADFAGITANTTFVLTSADSDRLLPEFLPYLLQTESFHRNSVGRSRGSVNPYVVFSDISGHNVLLPPLATQRQIASAIASIDGARERLRELRHATRVGMDATFEHLIGAELRATHGSVESYCDFVTDGEHNPPARVDNGVPYLVVANLENGSVNLSSCTFVSEDEYQRSSRRYTARAGDILLSCVGSIGEVAIVPPGLRFAADRGLAIYRPREDAMTSDFLYWLLQSRSSQRYFAMKTAGTAQAHLYLGDLRAQPVSVPPRESQVAIVRAMHAMASSDRCVAERSVGLQAMRAAFLRHIEAGE